MHNVKTAIADQRPQGRAIVLKHMDEPAEPGPGEPSAKRSGWFRFQHNGPQVPMKVARCGHCNFEVRIARNFPDQSSVQRDTIGMANGQNRKGGS